MKLLGQKSIDQMESTLVEGFILIGESTVRHILFVLVLIFSVMAAAPVLALRCGSDLIDEGDTKFELLKKCGEPTASEFVGYKLNEFGQRELVIEHLIYGPWSGVYYQIEVVGGEVEKIESFRDW